MSTWLKKTKQPETISKTKEYIFGDPEMDFYDDNTYLYDNYGHCQWFTWRAVDGVVIDPVNNWTFNPNIQQKYAEWFQRKLNELILK